MVSEDIVGTWLSEVSYDKNGKQKNHRFSKCQITFEEDGSAHLKVFFLNIHTMWAIVDDRIFIINQKSNYKSELYFVDGELHMVDPTDKSRAVFHRI